MKKQFALMLAFLLISMTGCITDNDKDKDEKGLNTGDTLPQGDYFPLAPGSVWNYSVTGSEWDSEYTYDFTWTVAGTETMNGVVYYVITDDGDSTHIRVEDNAIHTPDFFDPDDITAKPAAFSDAGKAAVMQTLAAEGEMVMVDFGRPVGEAWIIYDGSDTGDDYTITYSYTGKIIGTETVTVPAGTFPDCAKVELLLSGASSFTVDSTAYSNEWRNTRILWFADGVGFVKETDSSEEIRDGEAVEIETAETSLISYSLAN